MAYLSSKDEEKIHHQLVEAIKQKLLDGFKDKRHRLVDRLESINVNYEIDETESTRDVLVIKSVHSMARAWVILQNHDATTNVDLQIRINKPINFTFNDSSQEYQIADESGIELIDTTIL